MSQFCPLAITARLQNLSLVPVHQKGRGLFSRKVPTSSRHDKDHVFMELSNRQKLLDDGKI